jgi:hypothetical protein
MSNLSYDEKNQQDFDANTDIIHGALDKISSTASLKATISQLSELTGLHRNTLRDREWPIERINKIKEERKVRAVLQKPEKKDQVKELESQLDKACKEVVLWFTKFKEKEQDFNRLELQRDRLTEAKDFYQKELMLERDRVKNLEEELLRTRELLQGLK